MTNDVFGRRPTVSVRAVVQPGVAARAALATSLAGLHREAFPGFFLTSLGPGFLRRLYAGFLAHDQGVCVVAEEGGVVVGFASGPLKPAAFFAGLLRRQWLGFAVAAVPGLLRNPLFAVRKCLGAVLYRGETLEALPDAALLSSLAVSPTVQGRGVGQMLVRAFADEVRRRGSKALYLTTDEADNERTNRFYARCGFELLDTFKRPGNRVMNRWVMRLP